MPCASGAEWGNLEPESGILFSSHAKSKLPWWSENSSKEFWWEMPCAYLKGGISTHIPGCDRMESLLHLQGTPAAWICYQCRGRKTPFSWEVSFEIPVDEDWKDVIFGTYADKWIILSKPWVQSQGWRWKLGSAEWEWEAATYLVISRERRVFMTTRKHQNIH